MVMKKISILIVKFSYNNIGGVDRQILRLSSKLNKSGLFDTMLATNDKKSPLALEFNMNGGVVHEFNYRDKSLIKASIDILQIVKRNRIDIIQSHLFRESIICRLVKLQYFKTKHIFRVQTFIDCAWIPTWKKDVYHIIDYVSSILVNVYIANGPVVEKEIIKRSKIQKQKVVDIINGTEKIGTPDIPNYHRLPKKMAMVANLLEKKGHDVLIRALVLLKNEGIIINVRLIGSELKETSINQKNSFKYKLMKYATEQDIINQLEFYGYTQDIPKSLKNIPIVVLPSDSEGVPNSILEAMSLKKIVVASDVGAVSTFVENGKNGFLHSPQNPEQLAKIIKNIFSMSSDELNNIRQSAFNQWKKKYTLEIMYNKLTEVYESLQY